LAYYKKRAKSEAVMLQNTPPRAYLFIHIKIWNFTG